MLGKAPQDRLNPPEEPRTVHQSGLEVWEGVGISYTERCHLHLAYVSQPGPWG